MKPVARPRVCVDMDEVMADAVAEHLLRYNRDFDEQLTTDDLEGKWLWEAVTEDRHDALEAYLRSDDFFAVLAVMPDAPRVLHAMQARYEIFIASAAMEVPTSFNAKFQWLREHFPFIEPSHIVFCGDKGILAAEYLIDDNPRQLRRFRGQGVLYGAPHNVRITEWPRVANWLEVEDYFLRQR